MLQKGVRKVILLVSSDIETNVIVLHCLLRNIHFTEVIAKKQIGLYNAEKEVLLY